MDPMRRFPAILLLALFSFSLLSPAFSSDSDANLPACCRRAGKHHCSMAMGGEASSSGASFKANVRCPVYPGVALYPGGGSAARMTTAPSLDPPAIGHALLVHASQPDRAVVRARAHHKRGPPSFSS
jgi:hypothetical protein